MIRPIHVVVPGRPVSFQSRTPALREWKQKVAYAARSRIEEPTLDDLAVSITHYYRYRPRCDTDNMSKAICDALSNVVYRDDRQIAERIARRLPLGGSFAITGMPKELAFALCQGDEFVFIRIAPLRSCGESLIRSRAALLWPS